MFKLHTEMLDGKEITVCTENVAVKCRAIAHNLINGKFWPQLKVTPLHDSHEEELEITPKTYNKYGSQICITVSWKDDNYDVPPSTVKLYMMNYEGEFIDKQVEIQYTKDGDFRDDFERCLIHMLKILINAGELTKER